MLGIIDFTMMLTVRILFLTTFVGVAHAFSPGGDNAVAEIKDYCILDGLFKPTCNTDEVILIKHARYGRMRESRCLESKTGLGCSADVKDYLQEQCSGKRSCQVMIGTIMAGKTSPCGVDMIGYLEAAHICETVIQAPDKYCNLEGPLEIRQQHGYLSSLAMEEAMCGSSNNAWWITVKPGQKLRMHLLNFGPLVLGGSNVCHVLAVINEKAARKTESVCAGALRESLVYTSTTNKVEVKLVGANEEEGKGHFLLKFQAFGCPDPAPPVNGWSKRSEDEVIMECTNVNNPIQRWSLHCHGTEWIGDAHNCTKGGPSARPQSVQGWGSFMQSYGFYILVITGIVVCASLCIMLVALIYIKRNWKRDKSPTRPACDAKEDPKETRRSLMNNVKVDDYFAESDFCPAHDVYPQGTAQRTKPNTPAFEPVILPPYATVCSRKGKPQQKRADHEDHEYEIPQMMKLGGGQGSLKSHKYYKVDPNLVQNGADIQMI